MAEQTFQLRGQVIEESTRQGLSARPRRLK